VPILFLLSVALMLLASELLVRGLENIGVRLRFSEGLLGLVTAFGANAPEISSACSAVFSDHHDLGLGIVLGSNVFNLAALLGVSAIVAGPLRIGRQGLLLNGCMGLVAASLMAMMLLGWLSPRVCLALLGPALVAYVAVLSVAPARIRRMPLPGPAKRFLETAVGHAHRDTRPRRARVRGRRDVVVVVVSLVVVVIASIGTVRSATALSQRWDLPHAVMGAGVLAVLTSLPNLVAALRLARDGWGAAVVSETLNSNSLNVLAGVCIPALLFGLGDISTEVRLTLVWLLGMTVVALGVASRRSGLHRAGGVALVALYVLFVRVVIVG